MTRYEPSLVVTRALVQRGQLTAYDERFHSGVNIVRGENSSGKSTILNLIFYGLGGDLADWSAEALLCSRVMLEVQLNGKTATLSRDISSEFGRPMEIFGGESEAALKAPATEWTKYPYSRSQNKESFSQALFRLLGIPEVANEATGNLTMYQILRLLYADQLSPVENLFRFDRFDPPNLRDAIGRLLCGAYDNELYQNELRIRAQSKEFDFANGELKSLFSVLGKTQEPLTLEWVEGQRRSFEEERASIQRAIENAEREVFTAGAQDNLTLKAQDSAYVAVQQLQLQLGAVREELDALSLSMADSEAFIHGLEEKLQALNDADLVARHVGDVQFQYCPACYTPIESSENAFACHLCKTPFDSEHTKTRIVALINETAVQLKQSKVLQENRNVRMEELQARARQIHEEWQVASSKLIQLRRLPSSEIRERLRELQRRAGYLERQLEDLENRARLIELVDELSRRKALLEELN